MESIDQILDAWYLMRIVTLGQAVESRRRPRVSFAFQVAMTLCDRFLYARDAAPMTRLVMGGESFNSLFDCCEGLDLNVSGGGFSKILNILDRGEGVLVLAHWLTYIFDYQERTEYVWAHFPLFYSIARELHSGEGVDALKREFTRDNQLLDPWTGQRFAHRFYRKTRNLLLKTLETLSDYEGRLGCYVDEKLGECSCIEEGNWLRLLAAALYALTYDQKSETRDIEDLCQYAKEKHFLFSREKREDKVDVGGGKRLWSALRDYIVDPHFRRLLADALGENNPAKERLRALSEDLAGKEEYLEQLELPGDKWNEKFRENYLDKLREKDSNLSGIILRGDSRKTARRLFQWLSEHEKYGRRVRRERPYPVYLDVTFNLRGDDLDILIRRSGEIKRDIEGEIGEIKTEEEASRAYDILRRKLSEEALGLD